MSIICGTDLSEASGGALDVARALAAQRGDREVVLVHVVDPDASEAPDASDASDGEPSDAQLAGLRTRLEAQAAARRATPGPDVRTELLIGPIEQTLVGRAEAEASDLLIIAAQSRDEPHPRLGATAAKVIALTHVPVIVVRDPAPWIAFARGTRPLKILLGIDDSATCDLGVQWTLALGKRGPIDVVLGAIYYPDDAAAYYGLPARSLVETDPEVERLIQRDLIRRFGGSAQPIAREVRARARRGLGRIGDHMIELARDEQVDAIVVGTGQKTGLGRLGSVSSVIVEDAPESVVCVPPQAVVVTHAVPALSRAIVATDLSQFANRAVPYAFALTPPAGEVHVLHVVKDDAEIDEPALIRQLRALAPAGARQTVHAHIVRGDDTATTIAQCAARFGVDVICIASHGRSGLTRALVGSVADSLLRATRLPVLVLRPA
ncbi:MAG TPA: universal stress protein [Kofleriaceae bacterium]|jgi:nucleotide-binding universal stress UspA family protein|nr:universal stress protein [Kofleriaceae bacterium]